MGNGGRPMFDYTLPADVRAACRSGAWSSVTAGRPNRLRQIWCCCQDWAFDFLRFCQANPKPCPLLEVSDPGDLCCG